MFTLLAYLILILLELGIAIFAVVYFSTLIYSSMHGAPYVPTKVKAADYFLKQAHLKKGKVFLELGCGDGRVVRHAVKNYQMKGIGIDINPVLIFLARWKARRERLTTISFQTGNLLKVTYPKADVIYLFLFPELIEKMKPQLEKQLKQNTVIISHGFKIKGWDGSIYKTLPGQPFRTFFYRFSASK